MEANFYRKFWAGILTKGILLSVMANLLLNGKDTLKNYKRAFKDPLRFRWLDVDITNIYRALGGTSKDRKYFSILGHFKDPIKFITHPIRSAHHKGSFIYKFFHEALVGTDWAGRRFTTLSEILGRDYEKGEYKTTRKGKYKKGDPKYGKLAGKTVTWDYGKRGPLNYNQIPSFIISQLKGSQPIQIQNLLGWWAGEIAGFDASAKSLGLRVSTAYEQREEKKKKRYKVVK